MAIEEPTLNLRLLQEAAHAVWGSTWQACLARRMNVNSRTVRRWAAGDSPLPRNVAPELLKLCRIKHSIIVTAIADLAVFEKRRMDFGGEQG